MRKRRIIRFLATMTLVLGTALVTIPQASADDGGGGGEAKKVRLLDDCDPATFNAAIGPGTCIGHGKTTFAEFVGQLSPTSVAGRWKFHPDDFKIKAGRAIHAHNSGGETHSFTEVANFGGGCVDFLNGLLGLTPVPECATGVFGATLVPAHGNLHVRNLAPGVHKFECLIHPWMQAVVTVTAAHHHHDG